MNHFEELLKFQQAGVNMRAARGVRGMCLPNGWSAPTIDAQLASAFRVGLKVKGIGFKFLGV